MTVTEREFPWEGVVATGYEEVQTKFLENFKNYLEVGAGVSCYVDGVQKVDLYGGFLEAEAKKPYTKQTLNCVFSSGKLLSGFVIARLVDQGLITYETKIAEFWPEFAQNGKENVTISDILRHQSGLAFINGSKDWEVEDIVDLERLKKKFEEATPDFSHERLYHAHTQGMLLNLIVRIVDPQHRTIGKIYTEELNAKLGLQYYITLKGEDLLNRRCNFYSMPPKGYNRALNYGENVEDDKEDEEPLVLDISLLDPEDLIYKILNFPIVREIEHENLPIFHLQELPGTNGHANAETIAKIASIYANFGKYNDEVFISESTLKNALSEPITKHDSMFEAETTVTKGGFGHFQVPEFPNVTFYGWGGNGGSVIMFEPNLRFSFSYVMNVGRDGFPITGRAGDMLKLAYKAALEKF